MGGDDWADSKSPITALAFTFRNIVFFFLSSCICGFIYLIIGIVIVIFFLPFSQTIDLLNGIWATGYFPVQATNRVILSSRWSLDSHLGGLISKISKQDFHSFCRNYVNLSL